MPYSVLQTPTSTDSLQFIMFSYLLRLPQPLFPTIASFLISPIPIIIRTKHLNPRLRLSP